METVLIFISLLVLFDDALAQTGPAPERLSSTFKGILYNGTTRILDPHNLTANQSKQVQARLCRQMTYLVPWYAAHRNTSNCTIHITNRSWVYLTYTIPVTEDLIQKYDPSCSTYYILLANLVRRVDTLAGYHLDLITLENQNPVQLVSPSDSTSSTKIRVDGPVFKLAGRLRWEEFTHFEDLTKEVGENVRKQFVTFLKLHPNNGSYIHTEQKRIYRDPEYQTLTRMEAQITFNNSMLAANGINYTCSPFKELVKASLNSPFFFSNTSYLWIPVNILEEKSDGRSEDKTTASPASEQTSTNKDSIVTVETTTSGIVVNTTRAPPVPDSTVTVRTTTPGAVARITWRSTSIISPLFTLSILPTMM